MQLFFKGQMTSSHLQQEKQLQQIITKNISGPNKVSLLVYYCNRKMKELVISNQPRRPVTEANVSNVVYQFKCPEVECSIDNTYIGYTTQTLKKRMEQHYYSGAIRLHGQDDHDRRFSKKEILENTAWLKKDTCASNLRILESIMIKKFKPSINRKDEGFVKTLSIF